MLLHFDIKKYLEELNFDKILEKLNYLIMNELDSKQAQELELEIIKDDIFQLIDYFKETDLFDEPR